MSVSSTPIRNTSASNVNSTFTAPNRLARSASTASSRATSSVEPVTIEEIMFNIRTLQESIAAGRAATIDYEFIHILAKDIGAVIGKGQRANISKIRTLNAPQLLTRCAKALKAAQPAAQGSSLPTPAALSSQSSSSTRATTRPATVPTAPVATPAPVFTPASAPASTSTTAPRSDSAPSIGAPIAVTQVADSYSRDPNAALIRNGCRLLDTEFRCKRIASYDGQSLSRALGFHVVSSFLENPRKRRHLTHTFDELVEVVNQPTLRAQYDECKRVLGQAVAQNQTADAVMQDRRRSDAINACMRSLVTALKGNMSLIARVLGTNIRIYDAVEIGRQNSINAAPVRYQVHSGGDELSLLFHRSPTPHYDILVPRPRVEEIGDVRTAAPRAAAASMPARGIDDVD